MTPDPGAGKRESAVNAIIAANGTEQTAASVRNVFRLFVPAAEERDSETMEATANSGNGRNLRNTLISPVTG